MQENIQKNDNNIQQQTSSQTQNSKSKPLQPTQSKQGQKSPIQAKNGSGKPLQPIQSKQGQKSPIQAKNGSGKPLQPIQSKQGQKSPIQAKNGSGKPLQPIQRKAATAKSNGLPDALKTNMEQISGIDLSDVTVHKNSSKPAQLKAEAYAQGSEIHLAPGKEQLLGHETWHVIQQKQGRVQPTIQAKGQIGINDDPALEKEADVMGAKAIQLKCTSCGKEEEKKNIQMKEEENIQFKCAACEKKEKKQAGTVAQTIGKKTVIQLSTAWKAGAVHETVNLADMLVNNADSPITWHYLNGTKLATERDATGAIKAPTISTSQAVDQASGNVTWTAKVTAVAKNEGSFDETVLSPGPWTVVTPKATIGGLLGIAACSGAGDSTFRAKGSPSDQSVYEANRRHEDHHASDHKAAFEDIIEEWDKKLTTAKNDATEYKGASKVEATNQLWTAMGGSPEDIAKFFRSEGFTRGHAFHGTPQGGPMSPSNPQASADCSTSSVDVTNPS